MDRLEQLIIQTQLLNSEQLSTAHREAERRYRRLAPTIIETGLIDERRFAAWASQNSGAPLVDPIPEGAVSALERRIPRGIAREYGIVPLAIENDTLTVASVNPFDEALADVLRTATGMKIRLVVARYGPLTELVARYYPEDDVEMTILPPVPTTAGDESDDDELGNATRYVESTIGEDTNPVREWPAFERIESRLDELAAMVQGMQRRIDALESLLQRLTSR